MQNIKIFLNIKVILKCMYDYIYFNAIFPFIIKFCGQFFGFIESKGIIAKEGFGAPYWKLEDLCDYFLKP